jgi:putative MATE family efflux protein
MAMGFAIVACLGALLVPEYIMRMFIPDSQVIQMGAKYLRIIALSYLFYTGTTITTCVLRAVHTVRIAMLLSVVTFCVNIVLSWILIFGKLGAPRMGIEGAAIGTLCARFIEFVLLLLFIYLKESKLKIRIRKLILRDRGIAKTYYSVSIPVILNELFWALGETAIAMVLGRLGREVVSANSIYANISELSGVVVSGVNAAACVIVGNIIGAGQHDKIPEMKRSFRRISIMVGVLGAIIMLLCRTFVVDLYQVAEITKYYARQIMLIGVAVEFFRSIQTMNMMGLLRGAGDVRFAMLNDLIFLWGFTIPFGALAGLTWHWSIPAVYIALKLDQLIKVFTSEWRLRGSKWVKDLTVKPGMGEEYE